tara:strand:- start:34 stop:762 length:729 start_codon:yes stop_codon:yes gene_type:complete
MAMVKVTENAKFYNSVCNTKGVLEKVSWTGDEVDVQPLLDSEGGFILDDQVNGGFLLQRNSHGSYVIHTAFLPTTKVGLPLQVAKDCLWLAFLALDVQKLYSSACESNPAAKRLMKRCGFREEFSSPSRFGGGRVETFYSLDIDTYIRSNPLLREMGEEFHSLVEETTNHGEDEVHDYYAGAAVAFIRCANYAKAEEVYNRWALLAGYETLEVYENEKLIEVGKMKIYLTEDLQGVREVVCQ